MELSIAQIPKVELHAHINGSISSSTMDKLITLKQQRCPDWSLNSRSRTALDKGEQRTMKECFQVFEVIHDLVDSEEAVYLVTVNVIQEFAKDDNVKYLELRTTPRHVPQTGMSKDAHIASVLKAIDYCHNDPDLDITVRLLLAIDKRRSLEDAQDTVAMAIRLQESTGGIVVGIDFSGNPMLDGSKFLDILKEAKKRNLKTAVHLAEVAGMNDESTELLKAAPDRIGHGTFLHPEKGGLDNLVDTVLARNIPLEVCLTSNLMCGTVSKAEQHHFSFWWQRNHPCLICTDDKGVFECSLNKEYLVLSQTFGLSLTQLWQLSYDSINHIFEKESVKENLREKWRSSLPKDINLVF